MFQFLPMRALLYVLILGSVTGCSIGQGDGWRFTKTWDVRRAVGLKQDKLAPPKVPTRLVTTWQDTVLNRAGEKPERGFGGRLLFFNQESEDPLRVEGQLVVYAYDENSRAAHETQPTRRFVFPPEQFARHESECKLGASYSVWLPWDEVGGEQKNISLIARFEPQGGPLVVGDQTRHLLPGVRRLATGETQPAIQSVSDIRLTEYTQASKLQAPKQNAPKQEERPGATSIALSSKSWQQRLAHAQSEQSSTDLTPSEQARAAEFPGPSPR